MSNETDNNKNYKNLLMRGVKYFIKDVLVPLVLAFIIFYTTVYFIGEPLKPARPPDLELIDPNPLFFNPGDDITVELTLQNNGEKPANGLLVKAKPDSMWDYSGYQIGSNFYKRLNGSFEQTTGSFEFQTPSNFTKYPSWTVHVIANTPYNQRWDFNITYSYKPIYGEYRLLR